METDISILNACLPSPPDERDHLVSGDVALAMARPASCPAPFPVANFDQMAQVQTNYACVACAGSGERQTWSRLQDVSEQYDQAWLYQQCKLSDGMSNLNGTSLKAMLEVGRKIGFKTVGGKLRKIVEYKKIINPNDQAQMEAAIFLYHGVIAAVTLSNAGWRGEVVRMPLPGEATGGHGIFINGYDGYNYYVHDSIPTMHNGKCDILMPKTYQINEAWAFVVDCDIADVAVTGWIASIPGTVLNNTIVSKINLRDAPNGNLIKTLSLGSKIIVIEIQQNKVGGYSWIHIAVS